MMVSMRITENASGAVGQFDFQKVTSAAKKAGERTLTAAQERVRNAPVRSIGNWKLVDISNGFSMWRHRKDADSDPEVATDEGTALEAAAMRPELSDRFLQELNKVRAARVRCSKTGDCPESKTNLFSAAMKNPAVQFAADVVTFPTDSVADLTKSVPILGDITRIVDDAYRSPLNLATSIASGARLDRAVLKSLKDQVRIAKEAAPYAQAVVSMVPGVGTGVSAAIGAGVALAEGRGIDEAAKAAIKGALPGGPAASAAFDTAMNLAEGQDLDEAALNAARELVPEGPGRQAFDIGLAIATGENVQQAVVQGVSNLAGEKLGAVASDWINEATKNPTVQNLLDQMPEEIKSGYATAMGVLSLDGINDLALGEIRDKLSEEAKKGFDEAIAQRAKDIPWIGTTSRKLPSIRTAPTPAKRKLPSIRSAARPQTDLEKLAELSPEKLREIKQLAELEKLSPEERAALASLSPEDRKALVEARRNAQSKIGPYPPHMRG
jgi:hypothetical protein